MGEREIARCSAAFPLEKVYQKSLNTRKRSFHKSTARLGTSKSRVRNAKSFMHKVLKFLLPG